LGKYIGSHANWELWVKKKVAFWWSVVIDLEPLLPSVTHKVPSPG
jgi:hypothetical protein